MEYRLTVSRDRLAELKSSSNLSTRNAPETSYFPPIVPDPTCLSAIGKNETLNSTEAFFVQIQDIKRLLEKIHSNITEIEHLRTAYLSSINGDASQETAAQLDALVQETSQLNTETKNRIKDTETSNAKIPENTGELVMRTTQLNALKRRFMETIQRYRDIERTYEKKQRQRIERQILIVKPDATPTEIESTIDSDETPQIFAHSILNSSKSGQVRQVLNEVQTRHKDIKKIEKTIVELAKLFMDMQAMVEAQGHVLTGLEDTCSNTVKELEKGGQEVTVAVETAKRFRKRKWCCLVLFLILLAGVVGGLVWWFAFPHSVSYQL